MTKSKISRKKLVKLLSFAKSQKSPNLTHGGAAVKVTFLQMTLVTNSCETQLRHTSLVGYKNK